MLCDLSDDRGKAFLPEITASFGLELFFSDFELRISELSAVSHSRSCR